MHKDEALDILIVDDDATVVLALNKMLGPTGHIRFATTGARALSMMDDKTPDLVLLDVELPDIDGLDLCERIRSVTATAAVPVLVITGHKEEGIEDRIFNAGANDFIPKPVHPRVLRARVTAYLGLVR